MVAMQQLEYPLLKLHATIHWVKLLTILGFRYFNKHTDYDKISYCVEKTTREDGHTSLPDTNINSTCVNMCSMRFNSFQLGHSGYIHDQGNDSLRNKQ